MDKRIKVKKSNEEILLVLFKSNEGGGVREYSEFYNKQKLKDTKSAKKYPENLIGSLSKLPIFRKCLDKTKYQHSL